MWGSNTVKHIRNLKMNVYAHLLQHNLQPLLQGVPPVPQVLVGLREVGGLLPQGVAAGVQRVQGGLLGGLLQGGEKSFFLC